MQDNLQHLSQKVILFIKYIMEKYIVQSYYEYSKMDP
jgi:hypothetical protein